MACGVAGLGLLLLAIAGPFYRFGVLPLPVAFSLLRWAAYVGIVGVLSSTFAATLAYRRRSRIAFLVALAGLALGVLAFSIPYRWQRLAQSAPPIHDITTDLQNPPAFQAIVPLRASAPNSLERSPLVDEEQRRSYPDIAPLTVPVPPDQAFEEVLEIAQEAEWEIVDADKDLGRIEAMDTAPWFGFKDDVVVRLTP